MAYRLLAASLCAALAAGPAVAQNAATTATSAEGDQLQEIVVTAQFRQQNLQDTPVAITAVTAEMMEQRGQTSLHDLAQQARARPWWKPAAPSVPA